MNALHIMSALNVCLLLIIGALCVRYKVLTKIVGIITHEGIIDPLTTERYHFQVDVFGNAPSYDGDDDVIVMLGDSLTENTPFNELLNFRHKIKNRGISSDNTRGILHRIDEAIGIKPAKMFMLLGINDIGNDMPLTESMSNYREIVRRVKMSSPATKIYIQSVFPVDHKKLADNARCRRRTNNAITAFNAELQRLAEELGCEFVDTYSVFAVDGEMDNACTFDGLHLNGTGMMKWCNFLEQYMQ